jgi:hypothetical protein
MTCGETSELYADPSTPITVTATSYFIEESRIDLRTASGTAISLSSRAPFTVINSSVTITFNRDITLTAGGITCTGGSNLTIQGSATVQATNPGEGVAAIGPIQGNSTTNSQCALLQINSGTYTLTGGKYAPGVGASQGQSNGRSVVDEIRILGGSVTATGGEGAAGIGAGTGKTGGRSAIGEIFVGGGTIQAKGGTGGAAIGAGTGNDGQSTVESIVISGGTFSLQPGADGNIGAAFIGAGRGTSSGNASVGDIRISGGSFAGTSSYQSSRGAGVGGGRADGGTRADAGNIVIEGGAFVLAGTGGACIGGGHTESGGSARAASVRFLNGSLECSIDRAGTGSDGGAGIGGGCANAGNAGTGDILIAGGYVNVLSGRRGAGIGGGVGQASVGAITISGGTVVASSKVGSGIGAGTGDSGSSGIVIDGGNITASCSTQGAGMGAGMEAANPSVSSILVRNGIVRCTGPAGIGIGKSAPTATKIDSIRILGGSVTATGTEGPGIGIGGGSANGGIGEIEIAGGDVAVSGGATSTDKAAPGIGIGVSTGTTVTIGDLRISGGRVVAQGSRYSDAQMGMGGPGIGVVSRNSQITSISISGGTVIATGDTAPAIGCWGATDWTSAAISSISLSNCSIEGTGTLAVGHTGDSTSSFYVTAVTLGLGASVTFSPSPASYTSAIRAETVTVAPGADVWVTLLSTARTASLFDNTVSTLTYGTEANLFVQYAAPHANWSETKLPTDIVGVFVGDVTFARERVYRLEFWGDDAITGTAHFDSARCRSFLFVGSGDYEIPFRNVTAGIVINGWLCHNGNSTFTADRAVIANVTADCEYSEVQMSPARTSTPSVSATAAFTASMKSPYKRANAIMSVILYATFVAVG